MLRLVIPVTFCCAIESARAFFFFVSLVSLMCLMCCEIYRTAHSFQFAAPDCLGESYVCFWESDFLWFAVPVVPCELSVSAVPGRVVVSPTVCFFMHSSLWRKLA